MKTASGANWLLLSPGLILYGCFVLVPIAMSVYYSLTDWDGFSPSYSFVGLRNYAEALTDSRFHHSLGVTFFMTAVATIFLNVFGILFAVMLNRPGKMTYAYRSIFFFPLILSSVVVGFLWKAILNYNGILNGLLALLHVEPVEFLGDPQHAVMSIVGITIWQATGFCIVLYLAGLQAIPNEFYEAIAIDGATKWQQFRTITLPLLAPAITVNVVFIFTGAMKEYDRVVVLTGGGPGGASETIAFQVVKEAFSANRMGYASSLAVYSLILIGIISIVQTVILRKREERIL